MASVIGGRELPAVTVSGSSTVKVSPEGSLLPHHPRGRGSPCRRHQVLLTFTVTPCGFRGVAILDFTPARRTDTPDTAWCRHFVGIEYFRIDG